MRLSRKAAVFQGMNRQQAEDVWRPFWIGWPIAVLQKSIIALFVEVHGREGMSLEPAAEVGE